MQTQLLDVERIEEDLNLQLKRIIQESKRLEEEVIQFKKMLDEESIKSKFENSSRILDDILNSKSASGDRSGLGFNKEKKPECFSSTNQGRNKKSYVEALEIPVKKEDSKKVAPNSQDKKRNNMAPKRPNRYQQIFLGHCHFCNNFGHKAVNYRAYGKVHEYKKKSLSNKPKGNHNPFTLLQKYDIDYYKCNNHGHMARDCKLVTLTRNIVAIKSQDIKQKKY